MKPASIVPEIVLGVMMTDFQHHAILKDRLQKAINMHRAGRIEDADTEYRALLHELPGNPQILTNLGIMKFTNFDSPGEAITLLRAALDSAPEYVDALYNLGRIYQGFNENERAVEYYQKLLEIAPNHSKALNNIGVAKASLGSDEEARDFYQRAASSAPENENALVNRSILEARQGNSDLALKLGEQITIEYDPDAVSLFHLANQKKNSTQYQEAAVFYAKALQTDPTIAYAKGYLAFCLAHACFWEGLPQLLDEIRRDLDLDKLVIDPFSSVVLLDDVNAQRKGAESFTQDRFAPSLSPLWTGEAYSHDRIRVGYLSADYHEHATSYLMAELFESHDKDRFETYAISFGKHSDGAMRQRLVNAFDHFIDVNDKTDREVAEMMRELEIDIAIDLKGYTADARPGILSHRPCPVQAQYLGFPGTMGAPYIDYIIADDVIIPESHEQYYTEKVIRLPGCYQPYDSKQKISDRIPTRAEEGLPEDAYVYCCFNNNYKITPEIFDVWMEILREVPDSVLWLFEGNAAAPVNLRKEAEKRGVDPNRLIFAKKKPIEEHLARHKLADLFLDTIPCNAHTTARDALTAGVPVLTIMGDTFASRVAASLGQIAHGGVCVAESTVDYKNYALSKPVIEFAIKDRCEPNDDFMKALENMALGGPAMEGEAQSFSVTFQSDATDASNERYSKGKSPLVSVVCAVWSQDPNRWHLIADHLENLSSQTCQVEPIYVLEQGDIPPAEFRDFCTTFGERLSIYQAWSHGINLSNGELVMNLNLDDRLRKNAVETLRIPFYNETIMCVGGEWNIRFDIQDLPDSEFIELINEHSWDPAWPPSPGSVPKLRLGSGTGERGTYGPATMWRKSLFETIQYPIKFGNGDLIESIADAVFWHQVKMRNPDSLFRIPMIIGDYLSSPSSQAEFRVSGEHEKLAKYGVWS